MQISGITGTYKSKFLKFSEYSSNEKYYIHNFFWTETVTANITNSAQARNCDCNEHKNSPAAAVSFGLGFPWIWQRFKSLELMATAINQLWKSKTVTANN